MTDKEVKEKEANIYTDLSPVKRAAEELEKKLPVDKKCFSDEAWHCFYFETEDYSTMLRTIKLACRYHSWNTPCFLSIDQFVQRINQENKTKNAKIELDPARMGDILCNQEEIINNKPMFVYLSSVDSENASKNSKIMELFILYCASVRSKQNSRQIGTREAYADLREVPYYNRLFFVSYGSTCMIPGKLQGSLGIIPYESLNTEDFECLLWEFHLRKERMYQAARKERNLSGTQIRELKLTPDLLEWYANSMAGLEELKVRRLLGSMDSAFETNYADYTNKEKVESVVINYKNNILKQHGRLEVLKVNGKQDQVTGLDTIQDWLDKHERSIRCYGESPTGILLVGIPGTGKSATAKEAARRLKLPLVQLDMSKILGGHVGDSEKGMREMLSDLQFVAPCVLWIDEIEKAMSGADGKSGDGGTIKRLFGMLLTFIQDNKRPVFTVTTANDIANLPPEFFRNGRFDQTFCVMMPDYEGCCEIMQLKLNKYADKLNQYDGKNTFKRQEASGEEEDTIKNWKHFTLEEVKEIFNQCTGTPKEPRFLTGADLEAHAREFFWKCKDEYGNIYPGIECVKKKMKETSEELRVLAVPSAPYTMEDIAKRYLDMIQRGMTMAGKKESPYKREKLDLDQIRYYNFESDTKRNSIPLCLEEPDAFKPYKVIEDISKEDADNPEKWYDARFFYELTQTMSKMVFLDREQTMEETRHEYWKLKKYLQQNGERK